MKARKGRCAGNASSHRCGGVVALLAVCVTAGGCLGPAAVNYTRTRYNNVYRDTNDEQLLLNIVRLRYADSPVFIDLPNITSQFEIGTRTAFSGGYDGSGPGRTSLGVAEFGLRDSPTLSYHPRAGQEIARTLLTPLTTELLRAISAGATFEQFLLMAVNDINDVPNAARSTVMVPTEPDDNAAYRYGVGLLAALYERGALELTAGTSEDPSSYGSIPAQRLQGRDLVNAAKEGFVFRVVENDQVALRKKETDIVLRIRPAEVNSYEMQEVARIFSLRPGLGAYKIKSELAEEDEERHGRPGAELTDTFHLDMRSALQIAMFLSKGVCVPDEHVRTGIAPVTPGPDGVPFDWTNITRGLFFVSSQRHRPRDAEVAVQYRGYWFYITPNDVRSRSILAIFEILFALQESEDNQLAPLLTLPAGG